MVRSLVASEKIAGQVQLLFYLLAGVLGFGGNYAVFYALPFLFGSMNFILAYLEGEKQMNPLSLMAQEPVWPL